MSVVDPGNAVETYRTDTAATYYLGFEALEALRRKTAFAKHKFELADIFALDFDLVRGSGCISMPDLITEKL